jgi:ribonuclease P protein component
MLNKKYRLPEGIRLNFSAPTPFFVIKITKNDKPYSRFGFSVSKKTDKRAVYRNRVKRQVRACIEDNTDKIKDGYDLLFIIKKEAVGKNTKDICQSVLKELAKQKIIK